MPSWSARLLPASPAFDSNPSAPTPPNPESSPSRRQQSCTAHEPALQSYSIPSLQPSPNTSTSSGTSPLRSASRHGRSISHPFPSIFNSGKKMESRGLVETNTTTLEPHDGGFGDLGYGTPGRSPSKGGHMVPPQPANKDLVTGRCMTCDSLVRWPKDLKVFRCTICLMINDLKPVTLGPCFESGPANASSSQAENLSGPFTPKKGERASATLVATTANHLRSRHYTLTRKKSVDNRRLRCLVPSSTP